MGTSRYVHRVHTTHLLPQDQNPIITRALCPIQDACSLSNDAVILPELVRPFWHQGQLAPMFGQFSNNDTGGRLSSEVSASRVASRVASGVLTPYSLTILMLSSRLALSLTEPG